MENNLETNKINIENNINSTNIEKTIDSTTDNNKE
jgi:hypothetical protein